MRICVSERSVQSQDDQPSLRAQADNLSFSAWSPNTGITSTIVKAGHGFAFSVAKGQKFRITDLKGRQIVDFLAWKQQPASSSTGTHSRRGSSTSTSSGSGIAAPLADPQVRFSAGHTRWQLGGATPALNEHLYANSGAAMFVVAADTVRIHDMTFPCCYPELYARAGRAGHRACASNIAEAVTLAGYWPAGEMDHRDVHDPFNVFQNTPFYKLNGDLMSSVAGDYIEMVALMDVICAVSSCPYDLNGFVKPTEIEVAVGV